MNHRANRNVYPEAQPKGYQEGRGDKPGMTLREHYAGLAMQGLLVNAEISDEFEDIAVRAVMMANALCEELGK